MLYYILNDASAVLYNGALGMGLIRKVSCLKVGILVNVTATCDNCRHMII